MFRLPRGVTVSVKWYRNELTSGLYVLQGELAGTSDVDYDW